MGAVSIFYFLSKISEELSWNSYCVKALRLGSGLADLIEQNRRNSSAIFEDFAIENRAKMA